MRQTSVDDRLKQLVDMFNMIHADGAQLRYKRKRMPLIGEVLCKYVHSASPVDRGALYDILLARVTWADGTRVGEVDATVFVDFLKGTFVWSRVCGVDVAVPDSLHRILLM